jgi:hypothetical protein
MNLNDPFGTKASAKRKAESEERKREEARKSKEVQDSYISGLEKEGSEYFTGSRQRADQRDDINQDFLKDVTWNSGKSDEVTGAAEGAYRSKVSKLENEAEEQSKDSREVYTSLTPRYEDMMNTAQTEAGFAMSLQDAMDPNNKVATGTRQIYDQYGNRLQQNYNTEGDAAQRQYDSLGNLAQQEYSNLGNQALAGYNSLGNQAESGYQSLAANTQQNFDQYGQASQNRYFDEAAAARRRFEDAAQGENRLGLSNFGVMSALGAQAAQGAQGPGPMTLGQQMAGLAAANRQAGEAFANTQRRMQGLKDQGMMSESELRRMGLGSRDQYATEGLRSATSQRQTGLASRLGLMEKGQDTRNQYSERGLGSMLGLREKGVDTRQSLRNAGIAGADAYSRAGLERGFERSDTAYAMGQAAKDRYRQSVYDREALTDREITRQSALRGERGGYAGNIRGSSLNQEGVRYGNKMTVDSLKQQVGTARTRDLDNIASGGFDFQRGLTGMRMGREDIDYDREVGSIDRIQDIYDQLADQRRQMLGAGVQIAGTVAGGAFGGPAGAAAGNAFGGMVNQGMGGQPYQGQMQNNSAYQWNPNSFQGQPVAGGGLGAQNYGMPQVMPPASSYGRYNLGVNPYG